VVTITFAIQSARKASRLMKKISSGYSAVLAEKLKRMVWMRKEARRMTPRRSSRSRACHDGCCDRVIN
jgi:hypothetical protein